MTCHFMMVSQSASLWLVDTLLAGSNCGPLEAYEASFADMNSRQCKKVCRVSLCVVSAQAKESPFVSHLNARLSDSQLELNRMIHL
jgi:hypothetical protein